MLQQQQLLLILIAVFALYMYMNRREGFDSTTTEFVPVGFDRYGLRGDLLRRSDISRLYIRPDRHVRLSSSNNPVYESNYPPHAEGVANCTLTACPTISNEYGPDDQCWNCPSVHPYRMKIPDIHPHVMN